MGRYKQPTPQKPKLMNIKSDELAELKHVIERLELYEMKLSEVDSIIESRNRDLERFDELTKKIKGENVDA